MVPVDFQILKNLEGPPLLIEGAEVPLQRGGDRHQVHEGHHQVCAAFSNTLCVLVGVGKHAHAKAAITAAQQEVMGAVDFYAEAGY